MKLEIGGYFSIMHDGKKDQDSINWLSSKYQYQSARVCFLNVINKIKPKSIALPRYICDSVLSVIDCKEINVNFYNLDNELNPIYTDEVNNSELVYLVNYFGLNSYQVPEDLKHKSIIDNSQALFIDCFEDCLATIYSPRKFLPATDGGCVSTSLTLDVAKDEFKSNNIHMVTRDKLGASAGYEDYKKSEEKLNIIDPVNMSNFSKYIIENSNFYYLNLVRKNNFSILHKALSKTNRLSINEDPISPMCYPYLRTGDIKTKLIEKSIFVPTYWPEVMTRVSKSSFECDLVENLICIPIDQRYGELEMEYIIDLLMELD